MNISLACSDVTSPYTKETAIQSPSPSSLFVLIDTHEQSIWDATFGIFSADSSSANLWLDLPADRHNQGVNLSLADGHVEHWKWNAPKQFIAHSQPAASVVSHK
jgi:prepilin-type processing-associated H-X9-DG protein